MPQEEVIDVLTYIKRLGRFLVPGAIVALVVAVGLGAWALTAESTHTYNQKAHVLVYPNVAKDEAVATQQSQLLGMMMRTYVALEDVPAYTEAVSAASKGKFTPEQVAEGLRIFWGGGSNLLAFQATGENLDDTNELANLGAEVFVTKAPEMAPNDPQLWAPKLTVVERSAENTPPTTASDGLGLPGALAGGLGAGALTMLVLEALQASRSRRGRRRTHTIG